MQINLDLTGSHDIRDDLDCIASAYQGLAAMASTAAEAPLGGTLDAADIAMVLRIINEVHQSALQRLTP